MPTPARAELERALLEIRRAAERLRSYEPALADQLKSTIGRHIVLVGQAQGLPPEGRVQCERIVAQGKAVTDCIERAVQYPAQITARADVLDRASMLARMIRDLLGSLSPPPQAGNS
ncbi:MAG TPA: hypothetical protein VFB13_02170 [Reyranella sp.]|jgi:hypothetical protein|nr:hypothetical protein [Reyranella sp.]